MKDFIHFSSRETCVPCQAKELRARKKTLVLLRRSPSSAPLHLWCSSNRVPFVLPNPLVRWMNTCGAPVTRLRDAEHGLNSMGAQKGGLFDVVTPSVADRSWSTLAPQAEPVFRPLREIFRTFVAKQPAVTCDLTAVSTCWVPETRVRREHAVAPSQLRQVCFEATAFGARKPTPHVPEHIVVSDKANDIESMSTNLTIPMGEGCSVAAFQAIRRSPFGIYFAFASIS
jgi:hypothetical protein